MAIPSFVRIFLRKIESGSFSTSKSRWLITSLHVNGMIPYYRVLQMVITICNRKLFDRVTSLTSGVPKWWLDATPQDAIMAVYPQWSFTHNNRQILGILPSRIV